VGPPAALRARRKPRAAVRGNKLELPGLSLDSTFADAALARLFTLPSRVSADQWKTLASAVGSSATPERSSVSAPVTESPPAATHESTLSDLLADLGKIKVKEQESPKTAETSGPVYCRAFDWNKALALFQEAPVSEPGAHRLKLSVGFATVRAKAQIQYASITAQQIDADPASFDNKPVEIEVREARSSSSNAGAFPAGITKDDYDAYSVVTAGEPTRTRIAILVRRDTATSKLLGRTTRADTLRVRGIARVPGNASALSIVIDTAEVVEP
jgi:hypothetical protein